LISSIKRPPVGSAKNGEAPYDQIVADRHCAIAVVVRAALDEPSYVPHVPFRDARYREQSTVRYGIPHVQNVDLR